MNAKFKPYEDAYQYNIRAYTIPDGVGYGGCGVGWIELDDDGFVVKMRYAKHLHAEGSTEQNVELPMTHDSELGDRMMADGRLRIFCTFSCWQACIPIPH